VSPAGNVTAGLAVHARRRTMAAPQICASRRRRTFVSNATKPVQQGLCNWKRFLLRCMVTNGLKRI
jgi:hypothetical protein